MRSIFFLFSLLGIASVAAAATEDPIMCTMEYAPVCGTVQVQCITTPCEPVRQTFGNACMAGAAKATDVTVGECEATPVVGGDSDEHGCKASAGYSWDATLAQCIRVWEKPQTLVTWAHENALTRYAEVADFGYERSLTRQEAAAIIARAAEKVWGLRYASYPDNCNIAYSDESRFDLTLRDDIYSACAFDLMHGQSWVFSPTRTLTRAEALAIIMRGVDGGKKDESGAMWYENYADRAHELGILSFANFSGFDSAITRGELIEWIYRASSYVEKKNADNVLIGDWALTRYNDTVITSTWYTLTLGANSIAAKFCNNVFGSYSVSSGKFVAPALASTMMYCEWLPMTLENAFKLDGATYSVVALRLAEGATGPTMLLTITTAKGDVYIYGQ